MRLLSFSKLVYVNLGWFCSWNSCHNRLFQYFVCGRCHIVPLIRQGVVWQCNSHALIEKKERSGEKCGWKLEILKLCLSISLLPHTFQPALSTGCLPGVLPFCYSQWLPENSSFHQASSLPSLKSLRKICSFPGYHGSLQQSCFLVFFSLKTISKYRIYNRKSHLF